MILAEATSAEVAASQARGPVLLVVPLGSLEQHGPHLPLDADTRIAVAVAEGLERRRPGWALAPPLAYGASGEHMGFAGTLSIGTEALAHLVVELVRSADAFAGVVLVSGHGGNAAALADAVGRLEAESRRVLAWSPRHAAGRVDAHAGYLETSLLLAIAPGSVRRDLAEPGDARPLAELWPELVSGGVAAVSPNGVLGDPTGASAEAGRRLLAGLIDDCEREAAEFERSFADAKAPAGVPAAGCGARS